MIDSSAPIAAPTNNPTALERMIGEGATRTIRNVLFFLACWVTGLETFVIIGLLIWGKVTGAYSAYAITQVLRVAFPACLTLISLHGLWLGIGGMRDDQAGRGFGWLFGPYAPIIGRIFVIGVSLVELAAALGVVLLLIALDSPF